MYHNLDTNDPHLDGSVERVQHQFSQRYNLSRTIPAVGAVDQDGLGLVIDHTHHLTGNGQQLTEIVQPLRTLKTREKTEKGREKRDMQVKHSYCKYIYTHADIMVGHVLESSMLFPMLDLMVPHVHM